MARGIGFLGEANCLGRSVLVLPCSRVWFLRLCASVLCVVVSVLRVVSLVRVVVRPVPPIRILAGVAWGRRVPVGRRASL